MAYGIYIDGNLNTRTGGNSVFFSKFAEGVGIAELEFYLDYECHILITLGFVHHRVGYTSKAWLDGVEFMHHSPNSGTISQISFKRYVGPGSHIIRLTNAAMKECTIFVQGVP